MSLWKRGLFLLSLLALLLGAFWIPFHTPLYERLCVLTSGKGDRTYLWAGAGDLYICAVSRDGAERVLPLDDRAGNLELRFIDWFGEVMADWTAVLPDEALEGEICGVYGLGDDIAFLSFWQEDEAGVLSLCVYRVAQGDEAEAVLKVAGTGQTLEERRNSVRISPFSSNYDDVFFSVITPDRVSAYSCPVYDEGTAALLEEQVRSDILSSSVMQGGGLVLSSRGFLSVPERQNYGVSQGQMFSQISCGSSGIYCLESATMDVWVSDLTGVSATKLFSVDSAVTGSRIDSLSLSTDGDVVALLDGHDLIKANEFSWYHLTASLYPSRGNCLLALACWLGGSLFMTFLIWTVLVILHQRRIPLSIYWGTVTLALLLTLGNVVWYGILAPAGEETVLLRRAELTGSVSALSLRSWAGTLEDRAYAPGDYQANSPSVGGAVDPGVLSGRVEQMLAASDAWDVRNVHTVLARRSGQAWFLEDGTRAELSFAFDPFHAEMAEEYGTSSFQEGDRFYYCRRWGGQVMCVSAVFGFGEAASVVSAIRISILAWCAVAAAALLAILTLINLDARRLAKAMEWYASEKPWKRLRLASGDEMEGMAVSLNALAVTRAEVEAQRNALVESYRRFVPEPVVNLLGKRSILEVDKKSCAIRDMAVMGVSFTFQSQVYDNYENISLLFESVNQVIEHTASIASRNGGTVFNLSYDGYDVVFEDTSRAVSAAVAMGQEALSLNSARSMNGQPTVTLRMALDAGSVVVGIVGDEEHLEQTTISARFAVVRSLTRLCGKLEANILCTESVISGAEGYGNRYMGKCRVGQEMVRVYEIFDADPYGTRTEKASTLRRFSQGVLNLYGGELAQAKRAFLELAHETPTDGGARYYLFLADQLAQHPEQPCEMDPYA